MYLSEQIDNRQFLLYRLHNSNQNNLTKTEIHD